MATIEDYQRLVAGLIENDDSCPSPICGITFLGHLLSEMDEDLVDLVKAEDPEYQDQLRSERDGEV